MEEFRRRNERGSHQFSSIAIRYDDEDHVRRLGEVTDSVTGSLAAASTLRGGSRGVGGNVIEERDAGGIRRRGQGAQAPDLVEDVESEYLNDLNDGGVSGILHLQRAPPFYRSDEDDQNIMPVVERENNWAHNVVSRAEDRRFRCTYPNCNASYTHKVDLRKHEEAGKHGGRTLGDIVKRFTSEMGVLVDRVEAVS